MRKTRKCPVAGCTIEIANKLLMCPAHWGMCPKPLQSAVWRWYQEGQENRVSIITSQYQDAANAAILKVEQIEARQVSAGRQQILL